MPEPLILPLFLQKNYFPAILQSIEIMQARPHFRQLFGREKYAAQTTFISA
jgi:hypothetical protein